MDLLRTYGDIARAISEADIEAQRDGVRGQVAGEYQRLYALALDNTGEDGEGHVDVRFAELAVRILDRIVKLYRLESKPSAGGDAPEDVAVATETQRAIVARQLSDLAARGN